MFLIEDVISVIGQFFTPRDLFLSSRVNSTWHKVLIYQKKKLIRDIRFEIYRAHCLNNMCPCSIERIWGNNSFQNILVPNFKLVRLVCKQLNEYETAPDWVRLM
jgi:hypothetical protein